MLFLILGKAAESLNVSTPAFENSDCGADSAELRVLKTKLAEVVGASCAFVWYWRHRLLAEVVVPDAGLYFKELPTKAE